ncbi:MAG TPA: hypothetical protein VEB63_09965 [Chitinophagaceae bacterium]|nr:hypothetical protein [Chitinophagaceae bacterium]
MNHHTRVIFGKIFSRKIALTLFTVISVGAFATLGDGKKPAQSSRPLLSNRVSFGAGTFSLKSGYNFRGSHVISQRSQSYIGLNTVVSFQKGHTTYVLPLKKKIILEKVSFNPNPATRRSF